jgi:membrane protease YdiL (CAAX protease family)
MRRAGMLVLLLALGWVASWLTLGLLQGDPTLLLRPGAASDPTRIAYLLSLYVWLLLATRFCWKRWGPPPPGLRPGPFVQFFALGLGLLCLQRGVLWLAGWWHPPAGIHAGLLAQALVVAPLMALAEELVFRGYLYGVVREELGEGVALVGVNLFFALLHLFRPGDALFKLVYGFGLWLAGVVLTLALRRTGQLTASVGLHSSWILAGVVDPPGRVVPGWLPGLRGDPAAGLVGWMFLLLIGWGLTRKKGDLQ